MQTFIEELRDDHDATIVLTTHDLDEADRLCIGSDPEQRSAWSSKARPSELRRGWPREHGLPPTLESVFMTCTGRSLDDDVEEDENENDD